MLNTSARFRAISKYLDNDEVNLARAARGAQGIGRCIVAIRLRRKSAVTGLARRFMLGNDERIVAVAKAHEQDIAFTVDILGETVVSEPEANEYAARYLRLMELLARETAKWSHACKSNASPRGPVPPLNLSVKISALYSQIHPTDPDTAIEKLSQRLRPILRRAKELGAFINFRHGELRAQKHHS
jgi:RHH-type proline utilization regulon transcriptional repressor/proline dehydrogenase/delta 1-pyrroline-5-carboxylate dehydrogenase